MKPTSSAPMGEAGVEGRPPPAGAVRVDERPDLGFDFPPARAHPPRARASSRDRACPTCAGPRSRRSFQTTGRTASPVRGRAQDFDELDPFVHRPDPRRLAGQGAGNGDAGLRPRPRHVRRATRSRPSSIASPMARRDQKFLRARAAEHRRGNEAEDRPALRLDAARDLRRRRARARPRSSPAPLTISARPTSNCGLIRLTSHAPLRRERQNARQDEPLRDEADVADDRLGLRAERFQASACARRAPRANGRAGRRRAARRTARGRRRRRRREGAAREQTSVKPPVEAPTSRQARPAGSSAKASSAAASLTPPRET